MLNVECWLWAACSRYLSEFAVIREIRGLKFRVIHGLERFRLRGRGRRRGRFAGPCPVFLREPPHLRASALKIPSFDVRRSAFDVRCWLTPCINTESMKC